jgi:hypothetical protein
MSLATLGEAAMHKPASRIATGDHILPVCCVCGLLSDKAGSLIHERWVGKQTFRTLHGVDPAAYRLSHM